jgi:hypothetical protein
MSIFEYFTKHPDIQDPAYRLFEEIPEIHRTIAEIRQKILVECVNLSDNGTNVKLTISDRPLFEQYNLKLKAKEARLSKILETFWKLDEVIKPALAAGYLGMNDSPTPEGIKRLLGKLKEKKYSIEHSFDSAKTQAIARDAPLAGFINPFADDQKDILERIEFMREVEVKCNQILREL